MGRRKINSNLEELKQAIESFVIADATCSRDDAYAAYTKMLTIAGLAEYLPHEESSKS